MPLVVAPPAGDLVPEQPCDLRKTLRKNSEKLKDRPRFGRTFTCDDCGFVFSCEKLLIEHILTCTNRKTYPQNPQNRRPSHNTDNESSKSPESSENGCSRVGFKTEEDWPGPRPEPEPGPSAVTVKTEPEEVGLSGPEPSAFMESDGGMEPEPRVSQENQQNQTEQDLIRIKQEPGLDSKENPELDSRCELCGLELKVSLRSALKW